ncbi:class I adenylate-forming enzyme family protein [Cohnella silvisoli]|uniref:Class I adenylate-forming enzyme family protein n=1 Tax=Cohnella silvisoli TaxID=2873699 RepID=A0ABV1L1W6_9BACL|nr:class I adenylate-forming enzyme family protein [Cohnella silvisoli]MCD9026474.1 acyl--CoA ligase [Cohnella silvisoli]
MDEVSTSVARWAAKDPERAAVIDEYVTLSYGVLNERANRWVGAFQEAGVTPGDGVLLMLPNRVEFIEVLVATIRADVVPYFMNSNVAYYSAKDIIDLAASTNARLLITTRSFMRELALHKEGPFWVWCVEEVDVSKYPNTRAPLTGLGTDIVFFTSGTTGTPKGIFVNKSVFNLRLPANSHVIEPRHHLLIKPLTFRGSMTTACNILQEGNTVVVARQSNPAKWMELIERHNIFFINLGPSDFMRWLDDLESIGAKFPSSVKHIMTIGEPLTSALKSRIKGLPAHLQVTDLYGTSEAGAITMINDHEWAGKDGSCGRPVFFITIRIVDENDRELPAGEVGEVWVKTRYRMREYYGDPAATSETCVGDFVRTGDMGFLDEQGYLYLCGRKHDMIKRSGFRIFPVEVENVLREARGVEDAVVIGIHHPERMQEPIAFIRLSEPLNAESEAKKRREILAFCESRLARYKVPAWVWFVKEIPLNAAGKADRRQLAQRLVRTNESG